MSVNSFVPRPPALPSNSSLPPVNCFTLSTSKLILIVFSVTNILLILPLSTLVLYLGFQRHRRQRLVAAAAATSDSNIFTYQMAIMEIAGILGCLLFCAGINTDLLQMSTYGFYMFFCTWCIKIHFHTLTCVERYLAVVHPVAYLGKKNKRFHEIRRIAIAVLWLVSLLWVIVASETHIPVNVNIYFIFVVMALVVICFCCISVLCTLRRPRPGEVGRERQRIDPTKRKAINTVVTIMGALWLCLGGTLVCVILMETQALSDSDGCVVKAYGIWFSLPSSLVLPLLYLHREGKLPTCKH